MHPNLRLHSDVLSCMCALLVCILVPLFAFAVKQWRVVVKQISTTETQCKLDESIAARSLRSAGHVSATAAALGVATAHSACVLLGAMARAYRPFLLLPPQHWGSVSILDSTTSTARNSSPKSTGNGGQRQPTTSASTVVLC